VEIHETGMQLYWVITLVLLELKSYGKKRTRTTN